MKFGPFTLLLAVAYCHQIEVSGDGILQPALDIPLEVIFYNSFDFTVCLSFDDSLGGVFVTYIPKNSSEIVNTYPLHRFFVKKNCDDKYVLTIITISSSFNEMIVLEEKRPPIFQPESREQRSHPHILPNRGSQTTAVFVKFRNLSQRTLAMWYLSFQGELVYQGKIHPGEDSTTNSYEGHTFIFTPPDNQRHVISRHVVSKSQVLPHSSTSSLMSPLLSSVPRSFTLSMTLRVPIEWILSGTLK
jgi:hypothetical protein